MKTYPITAGNESMSAEAIDWEAVYTSFLPRIFHFFCYKVGDPQTAEELTAATFERAWAGRGNFCPARGEVQGWLLGIARHVAGDYFRRPAREMALEAAGEAAAGGSVDETVQRRLDFQRMARLLEQLSGRERELVALKYGAELTNREIARLVGLSESNVGTILHRVVGRLRKEWDGDEG